MKIAEIIMIIGALIFSFSFLYQGLRFGDTFDSGPSDAGIVLGVVLFIVGMLSWLLQ